MNPTPTELVEAFRAARAEELVKAAAEKKIQDEDLWDRRNRAAEALLHWRRQFEEIWDLLPEKYEAHVTVITPRPRGDNWPEFALVVPRYGRLTRHICAVIPKDGDLYYYIEPGELAPYCREELPHRDYGHLPDLTEVLVKYAQFVGNLVAQDQA